MFRLEDTVTFSSIESHKWRKNVNDYFRRAAGKRHNRFAN